MPKMSYKNKTATPNEDANYRLWRLLNHTVFLIIRSREKELNQFGINLEEAYVLDILNINKGTASIQEIVNVMLYPHHSISTLLKNMALKGLIKKRKSNTDARQYNVNITSKGAALFSKITRNSINETFSRLKPRAQNILYIKLRKLALSAYKTMGKKPHPRMFVR
jgi:DNA-binding MarR family transcriptional regulator